MMENFTKPSYNISDLLEIMALLRSEKGCPWDREQTHKSIRNNLIEEAYEVIEAIDNQDFSLMREELGDLLLQIVFHSRMAEEAGQFDFSRICDELCRKLIIRHPHVFGDTQVENSGEVLNNWDAIKNKTKAVTSVSQDMNRLPPSLPALIKAQKIGKKSAKAGFDYDDGLEALEKVREETDEVFAAFSGEGDLTEEIGDLLLAVTETARHGGIDAEEALNQACKKYIRRFTLLEETAQAEGICLKTADKDTKEILWQKIKSKG